MSNEQVEKLQNTSSNSVQETATKEADNSCASSETESAQVDSTKETVVEIAPTNDNKAENNSKNEDKKEPIDWFSLFLIVLVLANIGYWLTTRHRSLGPDMRVFLTSPSEQRFPIKNDNKVASHGILPPQVAEPSLRPETGAAPARSENDRESTGSSAEANVNSAPSSGPSAEANVNSAPSSGPSAESNVNSAPSSGPSAEANVNSAPSSSPSAEVASKLNPVARDQFNGAPVEESSLATELPASPFVPSFEGRPLTIDSAAQSGAAYEVKRDFLVNQYMYAAEVLDMYRVDTKVIFDCDANAQKFSVSGDNEAEMRAVQRTIEVSSELLRKTYNQEVAKAAASSHLSEKELKEAKDGANEAEALLQVNFSRSVEKYEDVLRRLKSK
ncbi:MAG: hypothetical protein ACI376_08750 [Candidatus Bruticola sp.]